MKVTLYTKEYKSGYIGYYDRLSLLSPFAYSLELTELQRNLIPITFSGYE